MIMHHEAITAVAMSGWYPIGLLVLAISLNARTMWRKARTWIRRAPPPSPGLAILTISDLVRIQPEIAEYIARLQTLGSPWTTLAGLLRELNAMAMSSSTANGVVEDTHWRMTVAAELLKKSSGFTVEDKQRITAALKYVQDVITNTNPHTEN